jgi:hypothetical protein
VWWGLTCAACHRWGGGVEDGRRRIFSEQRQLPGGPTVAWTKRGYEKEIELKKIWSRNTHTKRGWQWRRFWCGKRCYGGRGGECDRTTSGRGPSPGSTWVILGEARTQLTHKYNTIYWSSSRSYYNLGSRISYIEEVWSQNYASKDKSEFAEMIFLNGQIILFALKENVIHRRSKHEDPSTESNPHWFGLPTNNPHRHHR